MLLIELTHFHKIFCAICACLSILSNGVGFGFTSQLTYSLKHGYDDKIEVTNVDISWMGIKPFDTILMYLFKTIQFRCNFLSWIHLGLFWRRLGITVHWKEDHNGLMQFCMLHIMADISTIHK